MARASIPCAAAVALCTSLAVGPAQAANMDIDYDLASSALHVDYDEVNGLDWYTSLPLGLTGLQVSPADPTLTVNVRFRSAGNLPQVLLLDQMGLGGAQNAPVTFASPSFIGSGVAGGHGFGPSLVLAAASALSAGTATLTPTVFSGALSPGFTGATSGTCPMGTTCDYGVLFPDMIDGATTIGLSGFSVTFSFAAQADAAALNALSFNVIAPGITVLQVPEPATLSLMLGGLAALGASAWRGRRGGTVTRRPEVPASA